MTACVFHYRIYGLLVASQFALAEAAPCHPGEPDLRIHAMTVDGAATSDDGFRSYRIRPDGDLLQYRNVGRFLINRDAIVVDLEPCFDPRLLGLPLLGPVMALLLYRRGHVVLHGSAVEISGEAQVFLGDKGSGKSTTAAALVASGCPLIADDVVALHADSNGKIWVHPGFPAMKLDPGLMAMFPPHELRRIPPDDGQYTNNKSRVRLQHWPARGAVPLGTIHCLERGDRNVLQAVDSAGTLRALLRFAHFPRLGPAAQAPGEAAHLFLQTAEAAKRTWVDRLVVKDSLAEIASLASFLKQEQPDARAAR